MLLHNKRNKMIFDGDVMKLILRQMCGNVKIDLEDAQMSRTLVAYFSASGVTGNVAKILAEAANAGLYEIKPEVPYTDADLNWMDKKSRSSVEMQDKTSRPEMADHKAPVADADVIFVGFPKMEQGYICV